MRRNRPLFFFLLLLTLVNGIVFVFRERFQYRSFAGREELYGPCGAACSRKWEQFVTDFPSGELAEARRISDSMVQGATTPGKKVLFLAQALYRRFHAQEGAPSAALLRASPLTQYQRLGARPSEQLWCGNYAGMLAYFCWAQGIPARVIGIMKAGDQHILNECYLEDAGRWVLVDVTSNLFLVADRSGRALDFQQVREGLPGGLLAVGSDGLVRPLTDTVPVARSYYLAPVPNYYFHRVDNEAAYSFSSKLQRYFLPRSWYDIYDTEGRSNGWFWLKLSLFLLWIAVLFVFCIRRAKFKL